MTNDEIWLYKRSGSGTTVIPNPEGTATDDLEKIQIGEDIFAIPQPDLTNYLTSSDVGAAALSNSYNDLDNKPTIPTVPTTVSSFTNDAGYLVQSDLSGYVESSDLATVATSGLYSDLSGTPTIPASVEANPQETGTADLEKIKIGATVYDIPTGGGYTFVNNQVVDTGNTWITGDKVYAFCSDTGQIPENPSRNRWIQQPGIHFVIKAVKVVYNANGMYEYTSYDVSSDFWVNDVGYSSSKIFQNTTFTPGSYLLLWFC